MKERLAVAGGEVAFWTCCLERFLEEKEKRWRVIAESFGKGERAGASEQDVLGKEERVGASEQDVLEIKRGTNWKRRRGVLWIFWRASRARIGRNPLKRSVFRYLYCGFPISFYWYALMFFFWCFLDDICGLGLTMFMFC